MKSQEKKEKEIVYTFKTAKSTSRLQHSAKSHQTSRIFWQERACQPPWLLNAK